MLQVCFVVWRYEHFVHQLRLSGKYPYPIGSVSSVRLPSSSYGESYPWHLVRQVFSEAWLACLRLPLPPALYRRVLLFLPGNVIPYMSSPVRLADFLTATYDLGGVQSVLALDALFLLMQVCICVSFLCLCQCLLPVGFSVIFVHLLSLHIFPAFSCRYVCALFLCPSLCPLALLLYMFMLLLHIFLLLDSPVWNILNFDFTIFYS